MIIYDPDTSKLGWPVQDVSRDLYGNKMHTLIHSVRTGIKFSQVLASNEHNANMIVVTYPVFIGRSETPWSVVSLVPENSLQRD